MADVVKMEPASVEQDTNKVDDKRRDSDSLEDSLEDDPASGQQAGTPSSDESEEENSQSSNRSPTKSKHTITVIKTSEAESLKNVVTDLDAVDGEDNPATVNGEATDTIKSGDSQQPGAVADDKVMASSDGYEPEPMDTSTDSTGGKKVFAKVDIMEGSISISTKSESETKEETITNSVEEDQVVDKETTKDESASDSKDEIKTESKQTIDDSSSEDDNTDKEALKTESKDAKQDDTKEEKQDASDGKANSPTTDEYVKARVEAIEASLQGAEGMDEGEEGDEEGEEVPEVVWDDTPLTQERIDEIVSEHSSMPPDQLTRCLEFFWKVDTRGCGFFTVQDFAKVVKRRRVGITNKEIVIDEIVSEHSSMPPDQLARCLEFFWKVDTRGCGFFTVQDFAKVVKRRRVGITNKEIVHMFVDLDLDRNMYVTLDEYLVEMSRKRVTKISIEDIQPVFDELDANKDGLICDDDLDQWEARAVEYTVIHDVISDAVRMRLKTGQRDIDINAFLKIVKRNWDRN